MATTYYQTVNGRIRGESTAGVRTDYLTDGLGSVVATVNQSEQIVNTYRYKPYGELLAKTGSGADPRFLWTGVTGSSHDPFTGLNYNRNRTVLPSLANWNSRDPLWPVFSPYVYGEDNPASLSDPLGLFSYRRYSCPKHGHIRGYQIDIDGGDLRGIASGLSYGSPYCQSARQAIEFCKTSNWPFYGRVAVVNGSFFAGVGNCTPVSPVRDCRGNNSPGDLQSGGHKRDRNKGAVEYEFSSGNVVWGRVMWHEWLHVCNAFNQQRPNNRDSRTVLVEAPTGISLYVLDNATAWELCDCFPMGFRGAAITKILMFDGGGSTQFYIEEMNRSISPIVYSSRNVNNFFWIRERGIIDPNPNEEPRV